MVRGEFLSLLAARYHCTVSVLAAINHIADPSRIAVNDLLWIPANCTGVGTGVLTTYYLWKLHPQKHELWLPPPPLP